jgi:hypothetical protein
MIHDSMPAVVPAIKSTNAVRRSPPTMYLSLIKTQMRQDWNTWFMTASTEVTGKRIFINSRLRDMILRCRR